MTRITTDSNDDADVKSQYEGLLHQFSKDWNAVFDSSNVQVIEEHPHIF
jgi:hypothetical protein